MAPDRRNFIEIAASGAANFAAVGQAGAATRYVPAPGGGGYARNAGPLPPGAAVVPHDLAKMKPG